MAGLMPIGVFARATRLSIRVLRNYDRLGLLSPAHVDPDTGYRRYAVDQFARAGLIRRLRELEVPLNEIAEILDADTPERLRAAVERHRARITSQAARLAKIAAQLGTVLDGAQPAGWLHVYERWRDRSPVARIVVHTRLSGLAEVLGTGYAELFAHVGEQRIAVVGPVGCRYLSDDPAEPDIEVELFVPVARTPTPAGRIDAGELPGCLLAATVHQGGYDTIDTAYHSLGRWIAEYGRTLWGPAEELYLVSPGPDVPAEAQRTEVAWPVATTRETT
jgi:DNA-binding transcriptional MerR regulator